MRRHVLLQLQYPDALLLMQCCSVVAELVQANAARREIKPLPRLDAVERLRLALLDASQEALCEKAG